MSFGPGSAELVKSLQRVHDIFHLRFPARGATTSTYVRKNDFVSLFMHTMDADFDAVKCLHFVQTSHLLTKILTINVEKVSEEKHYGSKLAQSVTFRTLFEPGEVEQEGEYTVEVRRNVPADCVDVHVTSGNTEAVLPCIREHRHGSLELMLHWSDTPVSVHDDVLSV